VRFLDFKGHFEAFRIFSVQDILKWDPAFDTRRLVEWQKKNYVKRIVNRWYIFADTKLDENFLYLSANRIYSPSYVSFESALSYYRLIPEGVYTITSATTLKTHQFTTVLGTFSYRRLKPELMFGYRLVEVVGQHFKMAEPEKLLLDYMYLNSELQSANDFESLRINQAELRALLNESRLIEYLALFENKALEKRVNTFRNTFQYAER
jgi:predicted transcriptional regulator of viral defense system